MTCKLCEWLGKLLGVDARAECASFWGKVEDWDRAQSNEWDLWCGNSEAARELVDQAYAVHGTDREAALRLYLEAAEAGSVFAMEMAGWYNEVGIGTAADFGRAQELYHRAVCAGSWTATIRSATLHAHHGYHDYSDQVLEDGVKSDFIPAFFWLAWFRYKRSKSRETCREIRPLLERAAAEGHPAAGLLLARLMLLGKFGVRDIPRGLRLLGKEAWRPLPEPFASDVPSLPAAASA